MENLMNVNEKQQVAANKNKHKPSQQPYFLYLDGAQAEWIF